MSKHLVLVGGGHAHLSVLAAAGDIVRRGHRVTLVSPAPFHYYSGMGPGLLGGTYRSRETRFHVARMALERGAAFVEDAVFRVDPLRRTLLLASGEELGYDVASFNTGSRVPLERLAPAGTPGVVAVKPIDALAEARRSILAAPPGPPLRLLVAGGGPAGVEVAGNLQRLLRESGRGGEIDLVAGSQLLGGFPEAVRRLASASLRQRGVRVHEGVRVEGIAGRTAHLGDGATLPCDLAFVAVGIEPSPIFRASALPTGPDGGLLVNPFLQSPAHPELFGGGDCVCFAERPLDKVGVYAVRQGAVLRHNLLAALEGEPLRPFEPQRDYLLILNLGDGRGVLRRREIVLDGRHAFRLKDWIDRRFMRTYQVSGELEEGA